jgi:hypothetical protein
VLILEMFAKVREALLTILKRVDDVLQNLDYFVVVDRFSHDSFPFKSWYGRCSTCARRRVMHT